MDFWDSPLVWHMLTSLEASMAADSISHKLLQTVVGGQLDVIPDTTESLFIALNHLSTGPASGVRARSLKSFVISFIKRFLSLWRSNTHNRKHWWMESVSDSLFKNTQLLVLITIPDLRIITSILAVKFCIFLVIRSVCYQTLSVNFLIFATVISDLRKPYLCCALSQMVDSWLLCHKYHAIWRLKGWYSWRPSGWNRHSLYLFPLHFPDRYQGRHHQHPLRSRTCYFQGSVSVLTQNR